MAAQDRVETSRLAHPDILLAGIARDIAESVLLKNVVKEAGAIHAAVFRIGRAVAVAEILFGQLETGVNDLAHLWRIGFIACNFIGGKTDVGPGFFLGSRMHTMRWRR